MRFFFATGEADIESASQHFPWNLKIIGGGVHALDEFRGCQLRVTAGLALRIERCLQKSHGGHARDFQRILECQEHAACGALFHRHLEDVLPVEQNFTGGDGVIGLAGQDIGKGRLAGTVRSHNGCDFAIGDLQIEAIEDRLAIYFGGEVLDFEHGGSVLTGSPRGA